MSDSMGGIRFCDEGFLAMFRSEFLIRGAMDFGSVEATDASPTDPDDDCNDEAVVPQYVHLDATYEFHDRKAVDQTFRLSPQSTGNSLPWCSRWLFGGFDGVVRILPNLTLERDHIDDWWRNQGNDDYRPGVGSLVCLSFHFLQGHDFSPRYDVKKGNVFP